MALFKRRPKPVALESSRHLEELARTGMPVLVDFYQHGCSPCQVMDGIVNELAEEFAGGAHIVKANVANVPDVTIKYKVKSTPTFLVLTGKRGSPAITQRWRGSGLIKKDMLVKTLVSAGATPASE